MKKILTIVILSLFMVLGINSHAQATQSSFNVIMNGKSVRVFDVDLILNNKKVEDTFKPYIYDNRTFVPVRVVAEYFDSKVGWMQDSKSVTISKGDNLIVISVDKTTAIKNGEKLELDNDSIPRLVGYSKNEYKTMVPLRVVSELLGYEVKWNQEKRQATIFDPNLGSSAGTSITSITKQNCSTKNEQVKLSGNGELKYTSEFQEDKNALIMEFQNATFNIENASEGLIDIKGNLIQSLEYSSDFNKNTSILKVQLNRLVKPNIKASNSNKDLSISFTDQVVGVRPITHSAQDAILIEGVKSSDYNLIKLNNPFRYVIDIQDSSFINGSEMKEYNISMGFVGKVRVSQFNPDSNYNANDNIVRVVLDGKSEVYGGEVKVEMTDEGMVIIPKDLSSTNVTNPDSNYKPPTNPLNENEANTVKEEELITRKPRIKPNSKGEVKIVIDPGHGGKDPGASYESYKEKDFNLEIALRARSLLKDYGYSVLMTREADSYINPYNRPKIANENNAHVFVSIHGNSSPNEEANGIETLYTPRDLTSVKYDAQYPLADRIHRELIKETGMYNRGIKQRPDLIVLKHTEMPAALVELGFLSNPDDLKIMDTEFFKDACARAIANGIKGYIKDIYGY